MPAGLVHEVPAQSADRRDQRLGAEPDRVDAAAHQLAPQAGQVPPQAVDARADRPLGRHRGPGDPAAPVEEPVEGAGLVGEVVAGGDGEDLRAGLQDHVPVGATAAAQPGDRPRLQRGQDPGHQIDRGLGPEREARVGHRPEARLVHEHDRLDAGGPSWRCRR